METVTVLKEDTLQHFDSLITENGQSSSIDPWIGITHPHHDAFDGALDQGIRARGCTTCVAAGFEGHISRGTRWIFATLFSVSQGHDFTVGISRTGMDTLANHPTITHKDTPDRRVWTGQANATHGVVKGLGHEMVVP